MATKQYDNYADLITFTRASSGTALRPVGYGAELAPSLDTWSKTGAAATTLTYNSGDGSLDVDAATVLDGAQVNAGLITGKVYVFEADITLGTSTMARITVNAGKTLQVTTASSATISLVFLADDPTVRIDSSTGTGTFTINSASVKEVIFDRSTDPLVLFNHPTNVPRIEYDADGNRLGLLIEEQRANLVTYSETLATSPWVASAPSVTRVANDKTAPDGNQTATKVSSTSDFGGVTSTWNVGAIASKTFTLSAWVYADTTFNFDLRTRGAGSVQEPQNITVSTVAGQWVRVQSTHTFTASADGSTIAVFLYTSEFLDTSNSNALWFWGVQLEAGSFPTSYIPTSGSPATRNPDIASISTSAFGYNTVGTIYVDGVFRNGDTIITVGSETIDADADGEKDYAQSYSSDPSASEISFDGGTYKTVRYYPRVLTASQISEMTA
jgi:hypothetical protein